MNFNVKGQLVSGDLKDLVSKIFYLRFSFILLHPHSMETILRVEGFPIVTLVKMEPGTELIHPQSAELPHLRGILDQKRGDLCCQLQGSEML